AVEFALIIGVLAMLIFGMLQFGLTFFELQNLRAAAREGGRLGAVGATPDAIRADLESASNGAIRSGEAGNLAFVKVSYSDTGTFTGSEPNLSGPTTPACASPAAVTTDAAVRVQMFLTAAPPPGRPGPWRGLSPPAPQPGRARRRQGAGRPGGGRGKEGALSAAVTKRRAAPAHCSRGGSGRGKRRVRERGNNQPE